MCVLFPGVSAGSGAQLAAAGSTARRRARISSVCSPIFGRGCARRGGARPSTTAAAPPAWTRHRRWSSARVRRSPSGADRRPAGRAARSVRTAGRRPRAWPTARTLRIGASSRRASAAARAARRRAVRWWRSRGSLGEVWPFDHLAQRLELLVAGGADEELLAVGQREHVVHAPGRHARRHRRRAVRRSSGTAACAAPRGTRSSRTARSGFPGRGRCARARAAQPARRSPRTCRP